MTVDKSLSRGLADRFLNEMRDFIGRYLKESQGLLTKAPAKRAAVELLATRLQSLGDHGGVTQIVANHPRWRWAIVAPFLPGIGPAVSSTNRTVRYFLLPTHFHIGRVPVRQPNTSIALDITEHALERLFQRLNTLEAESLRDEIHVALCLSTHLRPIVQLLGHKQAVLPTKSGYFLCQVTEGEPIMAKTWLVSCDQPGRRELLAKSLLDAYEKVHGPRMLADCIGASPFGQMVENIDVIDPILNLLGDCDWLCNEHLPGIDRDAEAWRAAGSLHEEVATEETSAATSHA